MKSTISGKLLMLKKGFYNITKVYRVQQNQMHHGKLCIKKCFQVEEKLYKEKDF